jgi:HPr kinase/phosphorylase
MAAISDIVFPQVTVEHFVREHGERLELKLICGGDRLKRVIREPTLNRPGLALAGHTRYFACHRIQVLGSMELHFLRDQTAQARAMAYNILFTHTVPCVVLARSLRPDSGMIAAAENAGIPLFRTRHITMKFINKATLVLEMMSAPRTSLHGSMVDIQGVGVIIQGESGIGKSEAVLALIERGYSLVADDVVKVRLHDDFELEASANPIAQHLMEVRGIGIVDVGRMFGVRAVREQKRVDLIVCLKSWNEAIDVDRLGIDPQSIEILGIQVPHIVIPVRPGRDLARLIEVAALQLKIREAGYNPGIELSNRVQQRIRAESGGARTDQEPPKEGTPL